MKRFQKFALMLIGFQVLLSGCSGPSETGLWKFVEFQSNLGDRLRTADSLGGVGIPVLRSPGYEEKWGAPSIRVSAAGDYELTYADPNQPFQRLIIYGSVQPYPVLKAAPAMSGEEFLNGELTLVKTPQSFRSVSVAGRSVRWFQESLSGGADGAFYSTEGFSLTNATGKTGHYRMVVESGNDAGDEVSRRFSSTTFES